MNKIDLAKKHHKNGNDEEMDRTFDSILVDEPNNKEVLFMKAKSQLNQNKCEEGLRLINKAIDLDDYNSDYFLIKAKLLVRSSKYKEAKSALKKGLEINPNMHKAHILNGHISYSQNELKAAKESYSKAAKIEPNDPEGETNIAKTLLDKGEITKAVNVLLKLEKQFPGNTAILRFMGQALIEKGAYGLAEAYYTKISEQEPTNEFAKLQIAVIKAYTGNLQEAEKGIYLFNKNNKYSKEGIAAIGLFLFNSKRKAESINYLKVATKGGLCPNFWKKALVEACAEQGNIEPEIKYYKGKKDVPSLVRLAEIFEFQQKNKKAIKKFKQIIKLDGKNQQAIKGIARCYLLEKEHKKVVKVCKQGLELYQNDNELILLLINALLQLDKKQKALSILNEVDYKKTEDVFKKMFRVLHGLILDKQKKYKQAKNIVISEEKKDEKTIKTNVELLTAQEMLLIKASQTKIADNILDPVFLMGDKSTLLPNFVEWLQQNNVIIINDRMINTARKDIIFEQVKISYFADIDEGQIRIKRKKYKQKIKALIKLDITEHRIVDCIETNPKTAATIKKFFPKARFVFLSRKKNNIKLHQNFFSKESLLASKWIKAKKQILTMGLDVLEIDADKWISGDAETNKTLNGLFEKKLIKYNYKKPEYWKKTHFKKNHWKNYANLLD